MEPVEETRQGFFAMKQVSLRRLEAQSRDELVQEAELLRMVCAVLHCPLPPVLDH